MEVFGEVNEIGGKSVFEWKLKDFFSFSAAIDKSYSSPSFTFHGASWYLRIHPNGLRKTTLVSGTELNTDGYVGLYLFYESSGPPISIEFSLGLKTLDEKIDPEYHYARIFESTEGCGPPMLISRARLLERKSELVPSDVLSIICKLKYPKSSKIDSGTNASTSCVVPHCKKILQDLKQLFLKQENCDVVLRVKGQEFPAHKAILTARSPVFASTFRNDMREKATGVVDIVDCDPSIFPNFLCFLYSGDMDTLSSDNVFSLFTAADKYDVLDLRIKCVEFMKENLSVETFCETISLALKHIETELIHWATDFFIGNAELILETVEWQSFVDENPTQSNELFIKFVKSVKHSNT